MSSESQPLFHVLALVPVYNHGGTLRGVVEGLRAQGLEVLVVDDGSTEPVQPALEGLSVRLHRLDVNRGKGAALLEGARLAREGGFTALLTLDADGQHHPEDAPALLGKAASAWPCVVIGCRDLGGEHVPASSRFGRAFSNFWVRLESGRDLRDTQSGFRLYPVAFLEPGRFLTRRYTFEVEVLVRAAWAGLPILEAPIGVTYQPGPARISHFRAFRDNLRLSLLHTWLVTRTLLPPFPRSGALTQERRGLSAQAFQALRHPLSFLREQAQAHASPVELAAAVWLGVFLGSLPIIPFGLAVIFFASHRLRLNKLASLGASNVCVAPFVPFLCIQAGHLLLHGRFCPIFTRQSLVNEIGARFLEWALGALVVGPLLGLVLAVPTWWLVKRWQRSPAPEA